MGFFTSDDLIDLEQWAVDAQCLRGTADLRLEEPEISPNLKTFLRYTWGPQWEFKFVQPSGEVLICQLGDYLAGYNLLSSFNHCPGKAGAVGAARRVRRVSGTTGHSGPLSGRRSFSAGDPSVCFVPGGGGKNLGVA